MNPTPRGALWAVCFLITSPGPAGAQLPSDPGGKRAVAIRREGTIAIDGRLAEAAWGSATFLDDLQQRDPVQFAPPGDRTEVAFLYDDDALYVGIRAHSAIPGAVPRDVTRRDQFGNSEHVVVSIDPFLDRRTAYSFSISAAGVRRDYYHPRDADHSGRDFTYDPVWEARAAFDSAGWTAEMRIPYSQIRFNHRAVHVWGVNINRWIPQRNEDDYWVVVPRDETGFVSRFGTLHGIEGIRPQGTLEVLPYVAANVRGRGQVDGDNPFEDRWNSAARVGADLRAGLGSSLTLKATINPDFGQVEADPAQLNLSAFETIFDERRPFFTEGRQYIEGPVSNYFYSRRIGGRPRASAEGDYVSRPDNTTIIGAAKVTGRTTRGLQVGALAALTQREHARVFDAAAGTTARQEVEPAAVYGVMRLQQQFGASQSVAGVSLSGVNRLFGDDLLRAALSSRAVAGGADWVLRFQGGRYELSGHAGVSRIEGDTAVLRAIQTNSGHYFQRPDGRHNRLDPSRTAMTGFTAALRGDKNAGNWLWGIQLNTESPGFETNDMGRLQSGDDIELSGDINYRMTDPGETVRRWQAGVFARTKWNYDWNRGDTRVQALANAQWANYWETSIEAYLAPRGLSDDLTRGGPLMQTGRFAGVSGRIASNFANPNGWRLSGELARGEFGNALDRVGASVFFRPSPRWGFSIDPSWSRRTDPRQYVGTYEGGSGASYGSRYVFARVEQSVLSAQLRLNYTFAPDLTVEAYGQPFTASGRYRGHGELPEPRRADLREYGTDQTTITLGADGAAYDVFDARNGDGFQIPNRDFNLFSLRTNLVLRWEWRPGSTLFLVWQQNRSASCTVTAEPESCPAGSAPGAPSRPGFLGDVLQLPGDDFFAIKASYWLPLR